MQPVTKMFHRVDGRLHLRALNDIVLEQIDVIGRVARALVAEGHTVIAARSDPADGKPEVQLAASARLTAMVERDEAAWYRRHTEHGTTYVSGQFQRDGVRVVWIDIGGH